MRYRNVSGALLSACSLVAVTAPAVAQTIYTDRAAFLAATTNQVVSDFSGLSAGTGYGASFAGTDFTLTASSAIFIANAPGGIPNYDFNSGKTLSLFKFSESAVGLFTPAAGVTAFGFDYGVLAGLNTGFTINGASYTANNDQTLKFFGIVSASGVAPISVSFAASRGVFDNVTVASAAQAVAAVPEPATWAMMVFGFGAVGGAIRRRPRTSVRFA